MKKVCASMNGGGANEPDSEPDLGGLLLDLAFLRSAFDAHLPIRNSLIAWDILMEVLLSFHQNRPLQVKVLLNELPHSRTGIDYHYRWLIEEGWIEIHPCNKDRRVRYACPSERLITQVRAMMESLEGRLHHFRA
jgi:hypothetical protein